MKKQLLLCALLLTISTGAFASDDKEKLAELDEQSMMSKKKGLAIPSLEVKDEAELMALLEYLTSQTVQEKKPANGENEDQESGPTESNKMLGFTIIAVEFKNMDDAFTFDDLDDGEKTEVLKELLRHFPEEATFMDDNEDQESDYMEKAD